MLKLFLPPLVFLLLLLLQMVAQAQAQQEIPTIGRDAAGNVQINTTTITGMLMVNGAAVPTLTTCNCSAIPVVSWVGASGYARTETLLLFFSWKPTLAHCKVQ